MTFSQLLTGLAIPGVLLLLSIFLNKSGLSQDEFLEIFLPKQKIILGSALFMLLAVLIYAFTENTLTIKGVALGVIETIIIITIYNAYEKGASGATIVYGIFFLIVAGLLIYNRQELITYKPGTIPPVPVQTELGPVWYMKEEVVTKKTGATEKREAIWRWTSKNEYQSVWDDGGQAKIIVTQDYSKITASRQDHTAITYEGTLTSNGKNVKGKVKSNDYYGTWEATILEAEYTATPTPTKTPLPTLTPRQTKTPTVTPTKTPTPYIYQSGQPENARPEQTITPAFMGATSKTENTNDSRKEEACTRALSSP